MLRYRPPTSGTLTPTKQDWIELVLTVWYVVPPQEEFPHLSFGINGGFTDYNDIQEQLRRLDSVMVGRAVMDNSFFLQHADRLIFDDAEAPIVNEADELQHRVDILSQYGEYADGQWPKTPLHALLKPVINSFPQVSVCIHASVVR